MVKTPIRWFGGKYYLAKRIASIIESIPHRHYVEVFGGGASVLLAKKPSRMETYNDLDSGLYNLFKVLVDDRDFERFYLLVSLMPYSRRLYYEHIEAWKYEPDRVKSAAMWFVVANQSFSGLFAHSWGFNRSIGKVTEALLRKVEGLPEIHARLQRVQIECCDWRRILDLYDTPDTLFYLDPPYVPTTRRDGGYAHEMTLDDHIELVQALLHLRGHAVLSGYEHEIYRPLEDAGWQKWSWNVPCHATARTRLTGLLGPGSTGPQHRRIENVWVKPCSRQGQIPLPLLISTEEREYPDEHSPNSGEA